jgi:hypothetical protein
VHIPAGVIEGMAGDFVAINIASLDDVSPEELDAAPVQFEDGRHDDFQNPPAETRYL